MRRLMRLAQMLVAVALVGAIGICMVMYEGPVRTAIADDKTGGYQDSCAAVVGDSASYTICDFVLPGAADTSETFDVRRWDAIMIHGYGNGDSMAYYIDYSYDDGLWTNLQDSTFVNATELTTFPPTSATWKVLFSKQLAHTATVSTNNTVHFDNWLLSKLRIRLLNADITDTLINVRYRVDGKSK